MNKFHLGGLVFAVIFIFSLIVGGMMASFMFLAVVKFIAIVAVVESITILRWIAYRFASFFDLMFTVFSFLLMFTAGVTIGASFLVTALMWTILYRPYISYRQSKKQ
jgi:hypothetical protein